MPSSSPPRAIAIILGPLGSSHSMLQRYASWYHQRSCVTVTGASPPLRFMCNASLQPTAASLWQETLQVLRQTPSSVPVVVHMFSNGGSFVWHAMDKLLQEPDDNESGTKKETEILSPEDRKLLQSRLATGYFMFDSCPCYIRMLWDTSTPWRESFPYPGWSPWAQTVYTGLAATALTTWLTCTLSWSRPQQFWQHMTQSTTCLNHIYVYTTTDLLSDAAAVDRLVATRQLANVGTTVQYRYNDSNHCQLDKDHPEEYQKMIDDALHAACARAAVAENTSN